ncbi:siderophore-interacting protein [Pseudonocardia sp. HH130629-09]|uniref:siderophore-interacting protein n=1 Tax=Pseudonocardia sp. HH130629-09 TaxID=1641402 RepID=UPI0006CB09B3|nr:siderophore-interacting protein [Pseudonocardia sp. HH130629-09]ALE83872.1 FAD-binding protein [Pseudonocardia sp. HH130629-09]
MTAPGTRTRRPQIVLEVLERIPLSPHLVRIVAGGPALADAADNAAAGHTDTYAKMLFRPAGSDLVPPYDLAALREELPVEQLPSTRTYTIRRFDLAAERVWIDFVVHGDAGVAGPWAAGAQPGDPVVLGGVGGGYSPDPAADRHVLAGDESALPAIASALEAMRPDARGVALVEVGSTADELDLVHPDGVELRWLHRGDAEAGTSTVLVDAVRALEWPAGDVQVFAHGERGAMKALRPYLTDELGADRSRMSLSAYWAHGRGEDVFQAEKREPVGRI